MNIAIALVPFRERFMLEVKSLI